MRGQSVSCSVTVDRSTDALARAGEMSRSISFWLRSAESGGGDAPVANRMEDAVGLEGHDLAAHGRWLSSSGLGSSRSRERIIVRISVPPEFSSTQAVSGCCASLVATTGAKPRAQRMRIAQSDWPSRCESSWPTTHTT